MLDIQNQKNHRNIAIDKVGVKNISYPVTVLDKAVKTQQTVAAINMYVDLPKDYKGTHMSRLIEILNEHDRMISIKNFSNILSTMKERLNAESAHIEISFPYFVMKTSPVTQSQGLMEYQCTLKGSLNKGKDLISMIQVPVTTLCPCSKEISDYGAHNQRGNVKLQVRFKKFVWLEDLIKLVEECASCEVYSVLKRQDEKYVTEKAYQNPKFVEDIVRDIAEKLEKDSNITWFAVESENFESIHNHNAYAYIERNKEEKTEQ
jgi:GTP cyclohydrolase I